MPPRDNSPRRLVVEGSDDKHSIINLIKRHGVDWDRDPRLPFVEAAVGIDALLDALPVAAKSYDRLGAVLDADLRPDARWEQVRARLAPLGITVPNAPSSDGVIVSGFMPEARIGIWLMPDNTSPGILEDFLRCMIPAQDALWPHAEAATSTARALGAPVDNLSKGRIHTWLAWQEPPGMPFGTALTARVFQDDDAEYAQQFVGWFHRLFLEA